MDLRPCCNYCPSLETEEAVQAQNWGCLPSQYDIDHMLKRGKVWMCHSHPDKPCVATGLYDMPEILEAIKVW